MHVLFTHGSRQKFRYRYADINIQGRVAAAQIPIRRSLYRLNDGGWHSFYIETVPDLVLRAGRRGSWFASPIDWRLQYKDSPGALRLKELGDFNIEIPTSAPELRKGENSVQLEIEDHGKVVERVVMEFDWDPTPVTLPIELTDLSDVDDIQSIAQVVDGRFAIDKTRNAIVSVTPVVPDALCLLAAPGESQEATYRIEFGAVGKAKYLGLSDFFVRHEDEDPPIGIKPGWSTAGLATVRFDGEARSWISFGDNSARKEGWLVFTDPPHEFFARPGVPYRVRHQVLLAGGRNVTRFRIWPEGADEPDTWLCEESDIHIDSKLPRHRQASFGLFQHTGETTAWSDIRVVPLGETA